MNRGFHSPLRRELVDHPINKLVDVLVYVDRYGRRWVVPIGFHGDSASIPFPFRMALPRHGRYSRPAWLHDWLFTTRPVGLRESNMLMMDAMRDDRVRRTQRWPIRAGLMVGSWLPWLRHKVLPENRRFLDWYQRHPVPTKIR